MFKTIVIGTDGSNEADAAFAVAASTAQAQSARLVVVHVVEHIAHRPVLVVPAK